jgi:hypothetical protein
MLALFGAPPPASNLNPPLPLPLPTCMCWHCVRAAYEHLPLSPSSSGTSTRSAASGIGGRGDDGGGDDDDRRRSEWAGGGGGCAYARADDGGGDRRRGCRDLRRRQWSVVSGVCVRSRRASDARVTREWHPRNTTRRCAERSGAALGRRPSAVSGRRSAVDGRGRRQLRGVSMAGRRRGGENCF